MKYFPIPRDMILFCHVWLHKHNIAGVYVNIHKQVYIDVYTMFRLRFRFLKKAAYNNASGISWTCPERPAFQ